MPATTATAANIASLRWVDSQGRVCGFQSSRCYGIVDESGRMLARDGGDTPSTWGTLGAAATIAEYSAWSDKARWITPAG